MTRAVEGVAEHLDVQLNSFVTVADVNLSLIHIWLCSCSTMQASSRRAKNSMHWCSSLLRSAPSGLQIAM